MGLRAVAAVLEEATSIARRHRPESSAHRLYERLVGTCPGSPQQRLELGERFLDGIEIGRIGWQIHELAASPFDELAYPRTFVRRKVVHHYYLPRPKRRCQRPLQVGLEDLPRGRPFDRQAWAHPFRAHARQQGDVRSPIARPARTRPLPSSRPGIQGRQRSVDPHLVHEHEPVRVETLGHQCSPGRPQPLISLTGTHRSFFRVQPRRLSILEIVESLTATPYARCKNSRLWGKVASGCSSRFASKSFLAPSSSFGLEPGRFFGTRDLPSR